MANMNNEQAMPVASNGNALSAGMTKREMMAMHIAAGFAADGQITTDDVVKWSVEVADKLLQELGSTAK